MDIEHFWTFAQGTTDEKKTQFGEDGMGGSYICE